MWLGVGMDMARAGVRMDVAGRREGHWMWLGVGVDVVGGRDGCG